MDPLDRIDEIIALVETARSVPMSRQLHVRPRRDDRRCWTSCAPSCPASCAGRPRCWRSATRSSTPASARPTGSSPRARPSTHRLVSVNEITVSAEHEGARIIGEARAEAQRLRDEVDDYVDTALANFEQFLTRALASIERGRDKMHALREIGSFQADERRPPAAVLTIMARDPGQAGRFDAGEPIDGASSGASGKLLRRPLQAGA